MTKSFSKKEIEFMIDLVEMEIEACFIWTKKYPPELKTLLKNLKLYEKTTK